MRSKAIAALALLLALAGCAGVAREDGGGFDKVVYHISDAASQGSLALHNIRNQLEANPRTKIVVVTVANGVDFMFDGATDRNGNPYNIGIEELKAKGVTFDVCEMTLAARQISKSRIIPEATYVQSGVAEITRLQQHEGYAYLRP
jgi:intracellular sulfur oxidation DsrE/DsrF family protein